MRSISASEAAPQIRQLADDCHFKDEVIHITRWGQPAAVLISVKRYVELNGAPEWEERS